MNSLPTMRPAASRTANYMKGLSSGYTVTLATVVVGLWLTPFTLHFLDRQEFAIFTLASDLLMWLGLLDIGITAGLSVQAAQLSGRPDQEKLNRLASTAFFTQTLIVLIVGIAGMVMAFGFPRFFPVREDLQHTTSVLMAMLVLGTVMSFSTKTFSALLVAHQQVHVDNLLRLALIAIRTLLTVVLLKFGWGLYSLAFASLAATLITSVMAVWRTRRFLPGLQIRWRHASWDVLKSLGGIGIWFSLGGMAGIVITSLDRIVAARLISVESVTTLSLTGRMYVLSRSLLDQITNTARPMLGQLIGQNKMPEAARTYHQLFILSTGSAMIAAACIWAGNGAFVSRWVGSQNYGGWALDLACAFCLLTNCWVLPNRAALSAGLFKIARHSLSRVVQAAICLPLTIFMGWKFGLVGIVLSMAFSEVLVSCWYLPLLTAQMFEQSFLGFLRRDIQPLLACALLLIPVTWGARELCALAGGGYLGAVVAGGLTFFTGLLILWRVSLNEQLKSRVAGQFDSLRLRLVRRTATTKA